MREPLLRFGRTARSRYPSRPPDTEGSRRRGRHVEPDRTLPELQRQEGHEGLGNVSGRGTGEAAAPGYEGAWVVKYIIPLIRYLTALRISVLVIAGRVDDAERSWRSEDLPQDSKGCVDLAGQSWREMEAISLARLHWLIARERFEEGRDLARELHAVAVERHLRRTLMRASALWVVLEQRSGDPESAVGHMEEFLGLFVESPYAWPLVRERTTRTTCAAVLTKFLDLHPDSPQQETARCGGPAVEAERAALVDGHTPGRCPRPRARSSAGSASGAWPPSPAHAITRPRAAPRPRPPRCSRPVRSARSRQPRHPRPSRTQRRGKRIGSSPARSARAEIRPWG